MKKQVPAVSVLCIWRKQEREKDFTLVLLSGDTWFKLSFLMLSHGVPSHVQIGVCCSVSATRTFGLIYFLIPWIHADITHKTSIFEHLFDCDRTCAYCRQQSIFLALSCLSVRPSTRTERLCSHWTGFYNIWYLIIFRKSVENFQVWVKSDKNNEYFTWRRVYIYDNISLRSS